MRRRGLAWAAVAAYAALIWIVSSIPSDEIPVGFPLNTDKLVHMTEFGILAFLVCRAVDRTNTGALILAAAACIMYGVADEIHQSFSGRTASPWDALADGAGAVLAVILWRKWRVSGKASGD